LEKKTEKEERKIRAAQKMKQYESNIILDPRGGCGRTARQRGETKYTFEEYERAMDEAIDEGMVSTSDSDCVGSEGGEGMNRVGGVVDIEGSP